MKILSFSLDKLVADPASRAAKRMIEYGDLVEKYTVIVPDDKTRKIELSDKANVICITGRSKPARLLALFKAGREEMQKDKYDLISVQDQSFLALMALRLARRAACGLEIQVHGWERANFIRQAIARHVLPRADSIRTVSQRLKKQLKDEFSVKEEKISVVPIFVEVRSKKDEVRAGEKKEKFIFLTVGRLVEVKNISLQIEAMAEVIRKFPQTELWIVGEGTEESQLKDKSEKLKVNTKIKFLGWQSEVGEFYAQADAFILTSYAEGWPLVIIEAAAHGLPIIMTDMGSAGEFIMNEKNGLVVPINDRVALISAMIRLIESEALRQTLGQNALTSAEALPDKREILDSYMQSWQRAAKKT